MFTNQVLAVTKNGSIGSATRVEASSVAQNAVGSLTPVSGNTFFNSQYNYFFSGLLPATPDLPDSTTLAYFYRDIYMHDNVAGSCVDIQSFFPFSDWELRGVDEKDLVIYNDALERLNLRELLPQASVAYMTDGFYAGSLVFDKLAKNFMDIITHDALQCGITPSPLNNVDATVRVSVSGPMRRFLDSTSEFAQRYLRQMPAGLLDRLKEGSFILDPVTTLFIPRRGLTDRAYMSYLHRILPMYLIEKTMYRGTLIEANRRQRAMSHITAGDDIWTPTSAELGQLVAQFQTAEMDPLGGWITTRNAVQVQDLRPGGDFWKWTDMSDVLTQYKLRALGISEAFLSGDASYAAAESAYSSFLETVNGHRTHLTNAIFYKKIFPLVAVANKMFKDPKKVRAGESIVAYLMNSANKANLRLPTLHWHKDLTAKAEDNTMDMLEKLETHGVSIPSKMWLAAAGVSKDELIRDAKEDKEIKEAIAKYMGPPPQPQGGDDEFESGEGGEAPQGPPESQTLTSASVNAGLARANRMAFLNRNFEAQDMYATTVTGKKKHVLNQHTKMKAVHAQIAHIAARAAKDPHYRAELAKRNQERLGRTTLKDLVP